MIYKNRIDVKKIDNGWDISVYENDILIKCTWSDTGICAHDKARLLFDYYGYTTVLKSEYSGSSERFVDCDRVLYQANNL
uniref:Uncharacterized protein n=1 Tax=viral metagenome TaxID=1070528 RepID=A0A6M3K569_9ZZZZ